MSERIPVTPTIQAFLERMRKFDKENPKEAEFLRAELYYWSSSVAASGRVPPGSAQAEIIESHIDFVVQEQRKKGRQITAEKFIEGLFSPNPAGEITADIIMGRFQLG